MGDELTNVDRFLKLKCIKHLWKSDLVSVSAMDNVHDLNGIEPDDMMLVYKE